MSDTRPSVWVVTEGLPRGLRDSDANPSRVTERERYDMPNNETPGASPFDPASVIELPRFVCSYCVGDGQLQVGSGADIASGDAVSVSGAGRRLSFACSNCCRTGAPAAANLDGLRVLSMLQYQRKVEQFAFEATGWAVALRCSGPAKRALEVSISAGAASTWCEFPLTLADLVSVVTEYGPEHFQSYAALTECFDLDVVVPDDISALTDK